MDSDMKDMHAEVKTLTHDVTTLKETATSVIKAQEENNAEAKITNKELNNLTVQIAKLCAITEPIKETAARSHKRIDKEQEERRDFEREVSDKIQDLEKWQSSINGIFAFAKIVWPMLAIGVVATAVYTLSKVPT